MSLILSFLLTLTFNTAHAQFDSGATTFLLNQAAFDMVNSPSSKPKPYTVEECTQAAVEKKLPMDLLYVVRLASMNISNTSSGVFIATALCHDINPNDCSPLKISKVKKQLPLSLGITSEEMGCSLAKQKRNKKNYNYLLVRVFQYGLIKDELIFESYVKLSNLTKTSEIETAQQGLLLVFPHKMN